MALSTFLRSPAWKQSISIANVLKNEQFNNAIARRFVSTQILTRRSTILRNDRYSTTNLIKDDGVSINGFQSIQSSRFLHVTSSRRVIHPLVWAIVRPLLKGGIFIFGRWFRHRIWAWFKRNRRVVWAIGSGFVLWTGIYYFHHLETTPITKRRRFVMLNADHLVEMGHLQAKGLLAMHQNSILPASDSRTQRVRKITRRILEANKDLEQVSRTEWRIFVVESDENNAFVLPSGDIFFLTGMFQTVSNDDQLAIIISHELSHAILGHSLEMLSWSRFLDWFRLVGAGFFAVIVPGTWVAAWLTDAIVNQGVKIALDLPYNRKLESEADDVGLRLAAKACFDTRESYAFWLGLHLKKKVSGEVVIPTILSTHPNHGERAQRLDALIEKSLDIRAKCPCPPLKRYDPRVLADAKKNLIEQELAMRGVV